MLGIDSAVARSHAETVYKEIKKYLTDSEIEFDSDDGKMLVSIKGVGDYDKDFFTMKVNSGFSEVEIFSRLPVELPGDKLMDGALAACVMNKLYSEIKVEYDPLSGVPSVRCFRALNNFRDPRDIEFIISEVFIVIEQCTDAFEDIAEGRLSVNDYVAENFDV